MICPASDDDRAGMTPDILLSRKDGFLPLDGILTPHAVPFFGTGHYPAIGRATPFKYPAIGRGSGRVFLQNILLSVAPRLSNILLSVAAGDKFPAKYPSIGRALSFYRSRQALKYPSIGRALSFYRSRVGRFATQISFYRSRVGNQTGLRFNALQPFLGP